MTPADVKRVATKYLTANRVRLDVEPGRPDAPARRAAGRPLGPGAAGQPAGRRGQGRLRPLGRCPSRARRPAFTPPPVVRRKLSNGLEVLIAERHNLPILTLELVVKGGETLTPAGKEGLASLTATC